MKTLTQYITEYLIKKKVDKVRGNNIYDEILNTLDIEESKSIKNFIENWINEYKVEKIVYCGYEYDFNLFEKQKPRIYKTIQYNINTDINIKKALGDSRNLKKWSGSSVIFELYSTNLYLRFTNNDYNIFIFNIDNVEKYIK